MCEINKIAKKYLKAGFSVIPLNGKIPMAKWTDYQTRYPTEDEIDKWFTSDKVSIGIVTGEISGISVIDVDKKDGGLETIKDLHLPITWSVKTGGGGWHYYYKYHKDAPTTAGIYQGVDVRSDGGQVVAPPSMHETGNRYVWSFKEDEMEEFPIDLFNKKELIKKDWTTIIAEGTTSGNRNQTTASLFGKLFNMFRQEEWESVVYPLAQAWNLKNKPPISEQELRTTFESIASRAVNNKQPDVSVEEIINKIETPLSIAKRVKEKTKLDKKFLTWGSEPLDERLPLLELNTYMVLFGQFTSGKTTYAMYMARCNAQQGHKVCFLSLEMSKEKLVQQYAFKRGGVTQEKYKAGDYNDNIFEKYAQEINDIDFIGVDEDKKKKSYTVEDIEKVVVEKKPDVIVIDNLNKISSKGGSEIEMCNEISSQILFLTRQYPVTIVLIHHANKPLNEKKPKVLRGISGLRGTNKINDDADIVCELGRPPALVAHEYPDNISHLAVYKDRNWDRKNLLELYFRKGSFSLEDYRGTDLEDIEQSWNEPDDDLITHL